MIRLQLPQAEVERLEQLFQSAKDRKLAIAFKSF